MTLLGTAPRSGLIGSDAQAEDAKLVLADWLESRGRSEARAAVLGMAWRPLQLGADQHGLWALAALGSEAMKLRWIPAGSFVWGERHERVELPAFWLAACPCRQREWQALMHTNPSHDRHPDRPVEQVSWQDARAFAAAMSAHNLRLHVQLPTEQQWEYACRAGGSAQLEREALDALAWWGGNSQRRTQPVGLKAANAWGLHDMLGNVAEWCEDLLLPRVEGQRPKRVVRGGSWVSAAQRARADARSGQPPRVLTSGTGFRVAATTLA